MVCWLVPMIVLLPGVARAQEREVSISIEDAIRRAAPVSEEVDIATHAVRRAKSEATKADSGWYPQVTASASYTHTFKSEYDGLFDNAPGGAGLSNLPFGRDNTWRFGIAIRQNVFGGGRTLAAGRSADAARSAAAIQLSSARAQAVLRATEAYYDALLADRRVKIASETLAQAERSRDQTDEGYREGRLSEFDLLRARVAVQTQEPVVTQRKAERRLAFLHLKQVLDIPTWKSVELTSDLATPPPIESAGKSTTLERASVRQARAQVRMSRAAVDVAQAEHYPSVDLTMDWGRVAYPKGTFPTWDDFRTNWTGGVMVTVPLFTGFRISKQVSSAEESLAQSRAKLRQAKKAARYDSEKASSDISTAKALMDKSSAALVQAEKAHRIAALRYREGVSTELEVNDARLAVERAKLSQAQAARDLRVAKVRMALLGQLPLAARGAP